MVGCPEFVVIVDVGQVVCLAVVFGDVARHTFPFFADKVEQLPAYAETQLRLFERNWAWFDREMSDGRSYVTGETFTIADITGMAALFVAEMMEKALPEDLRHAGRWAETMKARGSFAARMPQAA